MIKGYPSSKKLGRSKAEHVNIKQISDQEFAMMTYAVTAASLVASDQTEALSDENTIVATGHSAIVGDLIRFTSGSLNLQEARVVDVIDANSFELDKDFPTDIGAGVDFDILRNITQTVNASGGITIGIPDDANYGVVGANTLRTAAQIGNATGAADFGSGVQGAQTLRTTPATDGQHRLSTRHEAAITPLSSRLSDGTAFYQAATETTAGTIATNTGTIAGDTTSLDTKFNVNLSSLASQATLALIEADTGSIDASIDVALSTRASEATLSALNGKIANDFGVSTGAARTAAQIGNATGAADFGAGAVSAQTVRNTPASDSPHLLATRHEAAATPLSVRISDGSAFESVQKKDQGYDGVDSVFRDYASSGLTAATWSEVIASTSSEAQEIEIFDSSGEVLELGFGAAASEVRQVYITPGGNGRIKLNVPAATRISVQCASNVNLGNLVINLYG